MKAVNVSCPVCGTLNRHLDLEETDGWMECEECGSVVRFPFFDDTEERSGVRGCQLLMPLPRKA